MQNISEIKNLVLSIIGLHETRNFEDLSMYIADTAKEEGSWFSEQRFYEVCDAIENELGNMSSLEYVSSLKRKSTDLTLWKATYSNNEDEVLWQITVDAESNKVKLLHINWEQV